MKFIDQLRKENILVVGFSYRTGLQTANYLLQHGISVSISDSRSKDELRDLIDKLEGNAKNIYYGKQSYEQLDGIDRIILSPGVPRAIPLIQEAVRRGIPVTGEIELAYLLCKPKLIIGITGTDGKTTTTTLVYEMLKEEFPVLMGGNIGIPFISFVDKVSEDTIVLLELSSYQLEDIPYFKCDIASILNIAEDHLDRYNGFDDYVEAKKNIFKTQDETGYSILNRDDSYCDKLSQDIRSRKLYFSKDNTMFDAYIKDSQIFYQDEKIIPLSEIRLKGIHNLENILAGIIITKLAGLSNTAIKNILKQFKGLPHRNELICTIQGIDFINDSKATTINAVMKSLISQDKPVILLMGGQDKGLNFSILKPYLKDHVKNDIIWRSK